jgi:hypothetical protein
VTAYQPYQAYPAGPVPVIQQGPPPILLAAADPAPQRRLTVFFRSFLAIPHFIVLYLLAFAAGVVLFIGWWAALFTGQLPEFAVTFLTGVLRWQTRVNAYLLLLTDMYPPFSLDDDPTFPVRVAVPPAQPLNRAAVFFRFILIIPANLLSSLVSAGVYPLLSFVAWLITLVSGRLPAAMHFAYVAVLRYWTRLNGYYWLLTPAYPGGLHGDQPGTPTWADEAQPGAGYGTPADSPFGAQETGYDTPSTPAPGYGATPGYGTPGYGGSGFAAPGYGVANPAMGYTDKPVFQPASWLLLLSRPARRLVSWFIALGVLFTVGYLVLIVVLAAVASTTDYATANSAIPQLDTAYNTLADNVNTWKEGEAACQGDLACVTGQDAKAAGYFRDFGAKLAAIRVPAGAQPDASKLSQQATEVSQELTQLSQSTSIAQYESLANSSSFQNPLNSFDGNFSTLMKKLESY